MPVVGTQAVAEFADLKALEAQVEKALLDIATRELGVPADQIVVRDADPEDDFGLTNKVWTVTPSSANAYNSYINKTVDDNKFVAIYGVAAVDADNVTLIKFTSGAKTLDIWDISHVQALQNKLRVTKSPIIVRQNTQIKIELYATSTDAVILPLFAKVAEVKGKTVEPGSVR